MADDRYPSDWDELAQVIKDNAGWCCEHCGHPHDPGHGYCLTVHHVDLDPSNCRPWNLAALCQKCHLHFQRHQDRRQLSFFDLPLWLKRYFDALQSKSSAMKP